MTTVNLERITTESDENAGKLVLDMPCSADERMFFNGFQSWSTSHEVAASDKLWAPNAFVNTIGKPWGTQRYGDNYFMDYPREQGKFHGFSYFYRRTPSSDPSVQDEFLLIASVDETNGYTVFSYDAGKIESDGSAPAGRLTVCKDRGVGRDCNLRLFAATGSEGEVFDAWFSAMSERFPERRLNMRHNGGVSPIAGYSSWYNRYENINDRSISADLEGCSGLLKPGDLFQIDDGWEQAVGDWTENRSKFPRGMKASVEDIHDRGFLAGLWLAPFVACKRSSLFREHPDWFFMNNDKPWYCGCNWGGFFSLDIDKPEVCGYLEASFDRVFNEWGFDLVKLDFLYGAAPLMTTQGEHFGESRGERMCRAMHMLRKRCGDKLILGCGVPLWPAFGLVDYCRIGCDAGLDWQNTWLMRHVNREVVSTRNSIGNSYYRRQLSGRAFWNDPDVFFLRDDNIKLSEEQKLMLGRVCAQYGDVLLTSDNMGNYSEKQISQYNELLSIRRDKNWTDSSFLKTLR